MNAGQKIEIEVTLVEYKAEPITGRHGVVTAHRREATFKGLDGQTYTQSTTGCDTGLSRVKLGETFKMKATVKEVTDTEVKLIRCRKAK